MEPPSSEFSNVIETLTSMFGNVVSKEVIVAVVESYEGDLCYAADALMNMSSETVDSSNQPTQTTEIVKETKPKENEQQTEITPPVSEPSIQTPNTIQPVFLDPVSSSTEPQFSAANQLLPVMSYSNVSRSTGAVPKQLPQTHPPYNAAITWTDQLRRIIGYHNQGSRTLILMRGVPGSGKSYLARNIIDITIGASHIDYKNHIFSTDDYFMVRGHYQYDKSRLPEAHEWNRNRVGLALRQGLSPVIVDNTNVEIWEMEFYVREGVRNGYIIEVLEPNTPWAKKLGHLLRRNSHDVPTRTLKRMLENYKDGITGDFLIKHFGLSYPGQMVPPVTRTLPEYMPPKPTLSQSESVKSPPVILMQRDLVYMPNHEPNQVYQNQDQTDLEATDLTQVETKVEDMKLDFENTPIPENIEPQKYREFLKQMEEFERVEREWENGETWGEETRETASCSRDTSATLGPRPKRRTNSESSTSTQLTTTDKLIDNVQNCEDWRQIALFMPSWASESSQVKEDFHQEIPEREIIHTSSSTCMEIGDTDLSNPHKILKVMSAKPRDINLFHIPQIEKMPKMRMLDKSTSTNETLITEAFRCKNEEQHFVALRKLFKNIPKAALRDIFDKCCGDVNWAVDIILGGMAENQLQILEGCDVSDTEEDSMPNLTSNCNCLAAYQVGIDQSEVTVEAPMHTDSNTTNTAAKNIPVTANEIRTPLKKPKSTPLDSSLQLKREIEKNIQISNEYYSNHVIALKNRRHGILSNENSEPNTLATTPSTKIEMVEPQPSSSKDIATEQVELNKQTKDEACCQSDDEESNASSMDDESERTVTMYLGHEFIMQLDDLFGRSGMTYPANVEPRVNIPVSLLNEINAFWMESLMYQLDEQDKQTDKIMKEDEDFAKELALKEAELAEEGKEPEIPDFKEIMDMDFALALYQKDVADWRNKEPNDMAAKMSRDKLFNLFPDMTQEILSELLMAHDNNFQATVEVLLMSTGRADILQDKNGLNRFVMEKEMERQEKLLEEEKKALSRVEWPLLPQGEEPEMSVVDRYREEAVKHLLRRNQHYQKAQDYIRRGMTQVASYYNEVATFHKTQYEHNNSLAAATLIQVHAKNSPDNATIDLHYLRVAEAKESLDLFLDTHIQTLREKGVPGLTLFFITGRGLHSNGRPRVKPAVKKRLRQRGLVPVERNPGLLTAHVRADNKLTYQVQ